VNFFRQCYTEDTILEATVRVNTPNLSKVVAKRDSVVANLEHALASEEITGVAPTHRGRIIVGDIVESIEAYTKELLELNRDVQDRIEAIEIKHNGTGKPDVKNLEGLQMIASASSSLSQLEEEANLLTSNKEEDTNIFVEEEAERPSRGSTRNPFAVGSNAIKASATVGSNAIKASAAVGSNAIKASAAVGSNAIRASAAVATATAAAAASTVSAALLGVEDGDFYEAGFVAFSNLSVVHAALQMVHGGPFTMQTFAAPDPEDSKYRD
jgi:hypothetical protein